MILLSMYKLLRNKLRSVRALREEFVHSSASQSLNKKIIASVVFVVFLAQSLALPSLALAQQWWAPTPQEFNQKVNGAPPGEIFGERYTHAQVWWIVYSIINLGFGTDNLKCAADNVGNPEGFNSCVDNARSNAGGGGVFALAGITNNFLYVKPVSGVMYLASVAENMGFPTAYAQEGGFGFTTALQPILSVWAAARNAAYALMTLAVVVLAFMIMFRMKISPQASVTVMSAIPRVIIGLLLITFSFAIAGFVIDMSYVIQGIIAALLRSSNLISNGITGDNGWTVIDVFNQMNNIRDGIVGYGLIIMAYVFVLAVGAGGLVALVTGLVGGGVAALIIIAIALILFLIAAVRIFWIMLRTYVLILFHVIALPFAALGYVASPSGNMFTALLRSLIGNASVFVTITVTTMFAHLVFWNMVGGAALIGRLQAFPLFNPYRSAAVGFPAGGGGMPGFGATDMSSLAIFIGLVILLMGPSIANNVKSLIISGRPAREGFSMAGAGFIGMVGGFAGGQIRQGAMGIAGVNVGNWGLRQYQLGKERGGVFGFIQRGVGMSAISFGQQTAQPYSGRTTGAIKEFRPRGTPEGTMYQDTTSDS